MSIKKAIESHRVSSKNLKLMCYPKMYACVPNLDSFIFPTE